MVQYISRLNASLALSLALVAGACAKTDNNAAADSALNKDIQLANGDSAAQPTLSDVPAGTATNRAPATGTTSRTTTTRTPTTTTRKPTTSVTSSGNTVTRTTGGNAAKMGTIANATKRTP